MLNKTIDTNVIKAERLVSCIYLLHNIIIYLEGTTHDPSLLQEISQIFGSWHAKTNVSGRSFSQPSKGATDIRNASKPYFNGPASAILSQNTWVYLG